MTKEKFKNIDFINGKKVFISIPITGREELARKQCKEITDILKSDFPDCELFNPFDVAPEKNMPDSYYMGKDIAQLMECDIVIPMPGWEKSKGCRVENCVADNYGIYKIPYLLIENVYKERKKQF